MEFGAISPCPPTVQIPLISIFWIFVISSPARRDELSNGMSSIDTVFPLIHPHPLITPHPLIIPHPGK
jgi:hypothetical protein